MLEKTLDSPLDCKEVQPVHPEGNQSWIFTGKTDAEAEAPILWLPDAKSRRVGKDCCWERLKAGGEGSNSEFDCWMASQLNEYEFEQTPGDGEGLGSLVCCSPQGRQESDMTKQ